MLIFFKLLIIEIYFCGIYYNFIQRDVAQLGSVHAWGAWGRRFKSCHPDKQERT